MFDERVLKRFRNLSLRARHVGGRSLLAAPRAKLPGGGTEPTGLRDYAPGDDFRHVDWTLCARRDELLTKVFEGDEDRHVYVLLDCSASMGLGTPAKFRLARQIAALLACVAVTNLQRVSLVAFADGVIGAAGPVRHPGGLPGLLRFLGELRPDGERTDLGATAAAFVRRYQRRGPVVVISDLFAGDGFQRAFDVLHSHGYEPRLVEMVDPRDAVPELLGDVELVDVEEGWSQRVTVTRRAAARYVELLAAFRESVRECCSRRAMPHLQIACDTPEDDVLLTVLGGRPPIKPRPLVAQPNHQGVTR
jgi:uncharacterized protein (DUF58 family)